MVMVVVVIMPEKWNRDLVCTSCHHYLTYLLCLFNESPQYMWTQGNKYELNRSMRCSKNLCTTILSSSSTSLPPPSVMTILHIRGSLARFIGARLGSQHRPSNGVKNVHLWCSGLWRHMLSRVPSGASDKVLSEELKRLPTHYWWTRDDGSEWAKKGISSVSRFTSGNRLNYNTYNTYYTLGV